MQARCLQCQEDLPITAPVHHSPVASQQFAKFVRFWRLVSTPDPHGSRHPKTLRHQRQLVQKDIFGPPGKVCLDTRCFNPSHPAVPPIPDNRRSRRLVACHPRPSPLRSSRSPGSARTAACHDDAEGGYCEYHKPSVHCTSFPLRNPFYGDCRYRYGGWCFTYVVTLLVSPLRG
jgi:hypothetical protein